MGKRGPKRKYETPQALEAGINEYFTAAAEQGAFPDLAGMRIHLRITQKTLDSYCEGDSEEAKAYKEVLDAAQDRRESWLARRMVSEPKAANGCMNALKQPSNGGYIDKPMIDTGDRKLTIVVTNLKGGEEAFK